MSVVTEDLRIPVLSVPFPVGWHPEVDHARQCIIDFVTEYDLEEDAARAEANYRMADFVALFYPFGHNRERLGLIARNAVWAIIFDDNYIERFALNGKEDQAVRHLMLGHLITDDPYAAVPGLPPGLCAWQRVCQEFLELAGPDRYSLLVQGYRSYANAMDFEIFHTTRGTLPDSRLFLAYRTRSTMYYPMFFRYIDYVADRDLPLSIWNHVDVRRLEYLICAAGGVFNEVTGMAAEPDPEHAFCLPCAIAQERGISLQDGIDVAASMFSDLVQEAEGVAKRLVASGSDDLAFIGRAGPAMLSGYLHWHFRVTRRYDDTQRYANSKYDDVAGVLPQPQQEVRKAHLEKTP